MPSIAAHYELQFTATDQNDAELTCLQIGLDVG
jgi:hypothetical protein